MGGREDKTGCTGDLIIHPQDCDKGCDRSMRTYCEPLLGMSVSELRTEQMRGIGAKFLPECHLECRR